jgi:hypothetical protein
MDRIQYIRLFQTFIVIVAFCTGILEAHPALTRGESHLQVSGGSLSGSVPYSYSGWSRIVIGLYSCRLVFLMNWRINVTSPS